MSLRHARQPDVPHPPPPHLNGNASTSNPTASPASGPSATPGSRRETTIEKLTAANEQTWLLIGSVAEQMGSLEHALSAYENVLRHNPNSLAGLTKVAGIARIKENYPKAIDYFQRVLQVQEENGEVWSALGHCYLMQDDLQKAYAAYQQALYLLPNPKEDLKLWYGIGILYDRYGSLDLAEEAFSSVLRMNQDFDKANEILFRLGIIYKQQGKFDESLGCLQRILRNPPSPLAHADIWFQIGHVYEMQKKYPEAKDAYERVVADNPNHGKVLQQLGWLYHQEGSAFQNQELAIQYLTKSLEADPSDSQSWYLLGRAYMAGQKYNKAYEAYQQAVYRDGRNPTFWCSIGVLYFQINQFRDALDAYSRAIRINPYISEVWFDLGSLYESCNNQISDAIDAYARASELDPNNTVISNRLQLLRTAQQTGQALPGPPGPQDVHPTAYASTVNPPGLGGPNLLLTGTIRPPPRSDSRAGPPEIALPHSSRNSPGPFRGGAPPPVVLDESRTHATHPPLAPMEVDRPGRDYPPPPSARENGHRGPPPGSLLLHQPSPQPHSAHEAPRADRPSVNDPYFSRPPRAPSTPASPHSTRNRSPGPPYSSRHAVGPGRPAEPPYQRSPRVNHAHAHESSARTPREESASWERRGMSIYPPPPPDAREGGYDRERERERGRPRHNGEYPAAPPTNGRGPGGFGTHSPVSVSSRIETPNEPQRALPDRGYFPPRPRSPPVANPSRRYDPRFDGRPTEYEDPRDRQYARSPDMRPPRSAQPYPSHLTGHPSSRQDSESPHPGSVSDSGSKRKRTAKDAEMGAPEQPKARPKKRPPVHRKSRDETNGRGETPKPIGVSGYSHSPTYKSIPSNGKTSPEPGSSNGSSRSLQPSPTSASARPPIRTVDEDYDEPGAADALIGLAGGYSRPAEHSNQPSPTGSRHENTSPNPSHPGSRGRPSPPMNSMKRPLSPGPEESEAKRSRMDEHLQRRASSSSNGHQTPAQSSRPSPIPFRTQPASHSPDLRTTHAEGYPPSPPNIPAVLPPHPRPVGVSGHSGSAPNSAVALPPIATLGSPSSTAPSPTGGAERDRNGSGSEKMRVDSPRSVSSSRSQKGALDGRPGSRSPTASIKQSPSPGSVERKL